MPEEQPPSFRPQQPTRRPQEGDAVIPVGQPKRPPRAPSPQPPRRESLGQTRKPPSSPNRPPAFAPSDPRTGGRGPADSGHLAHGSTTRPATRRPAPPSPPQPSPLTPTSGARQHPRRKPRWKVGLALLLALLLTWPVGLAIWANGKIQHVDALSGTPDDTPGTTYLLAGSDARGGTEGIKQDSAIGERSDTIMLLHVPPSGVTSLISLPRDTYVDIPGYGPNKLNSAFALGGPPLLVQTVEQLTGVHIDHYAEVGLGGVSQIVNAVGGVELCFDPEVDKVSFPIDDRDSKLQWAEPGCQTVDGTTAVAYARMRKADAEGDIGRARRQRRLIAAVSDTAVDRSLLWSPTRQVSLVGTGLGSLRVDQDANIITLGRLALAFRAASGPDGMRGTPPIANPDYRPGGVGSTVLLDPDSSAAFWQAVVAGTLDPEANG